MVLGSSQQFSLSYGFKHQTSSPIYPQANGKIDCSVKTVKPLKKAKDPYIALMAYHATSLENGYSPAELLLFGRKIQTTLPLVTDNLVPTWSYFVTVREREYKET